MREKYTQPSVSNRKIVEMRGTIDRQVRELTTSFLYHFILRKLLIPNQVSSTLRTLLFDFEIPKKAIAHLCRKIKHRSLFESGANLLIFR